MLIIMHRLALLFLICGVFVGFGEGKEMSAIQSIMNRCCSLGEEFGTTNLHCESYDSFVGIEESEKIACENIFSSCCKRALEIEHCDRGIDDYKQIETCVYGGMSSSSSCFNIQDEECCKCCRLGTNAGLQGMDCNAEIPDLGSLCKRAFYACCVDNYDGIPANVQNPTETTVNGMDECITPGVCQHRCVNTQNSYYCECYSGYVLQSDGITCIPAGGDRCSTSSPCEHQCTDTGDEVICSCDAGYKLRPDGRLCDDIDECTEFPCQPGQQCINEVGSFRCQQQHTCETGFEYNDNRQQCIDENECLKYPTICGLKQCVNRIGSYQCVNRNVPDKQCSEGYEVYKGSCRDINECVQNPNACSPGSRCENSPGSYKCTRITPCGTGYTVNALTQLCDDIDECALGVHTCNQKERCINYRGRFRCENCRRGFKVDGSNQCTIDINECEEEANACRSNTICQNTIGGYICRRRCPTGYKYDEVQQSCIDVNECTENTHNCLLGQTCVNRQGSFTCQCPQGYTANRITGRCEDVDECQRRVCQHKCTNTPGSFQCYCNEGFELNSDGRTCKDVDECSISSPCQQRCMNTYGSYRCYCERGYRTREDGTCVDNDECNLFAGRGRLCGGICFNTLGSYECRCPAGYNLQSDRRTCKDQDECALGLDNCGSEHSCFNIGGSFKCNYVQCPPYFTKDNSAGYGDVQRCMRNLASCPQGDVSCLLNKTSVISYNYLALPSIPALRPGNQIRLISMQPTSLSSTSSVFYQIVSGNDQRYFAVIKAGTIGTLYLVKAVEGPYETEIRLEMSTYNRAMALIYRSIAVIKIHVSKYDFM